MALPADQPQPPFVKRTDKDRRAERRERQRRRIDRINEREAELRAQLEKARTFESYYERVRGE